MERRLGRSSAKLLALAGAVCRGQSRVPAAINADTEPAQHSVEDLNLVGAASRCPKSPTRSSESSRDSDGLCFGEGILVRANVLPRETHVRAVRAFRELQDE